MFLLAEPRPRKQGGNPERESGPRRDIVIINAAAALVAAGRATDFLQGARVAGQSIDSGAAEKKLDALLAFSGKH